MNLFTCSCLLFILGHLRTLIHSSYISDHLGTLINLYIDLMAPYIKVIQCCLICYVQMRCEKKGGRGQYRMSTLRI